MARPTHITHLQAVAAKRLARVFGKAPAPVDRSELESIEAGRRRLHAAALEAPSGNRYTVLPSGKIVFSRPVRQLPPGSYPPEWLN